MTRATNSGRTLHALLALLLVVSAAAVLVSPHVHASGSDGDACPACAVGRSSALPVLALTAALLGPLPPVSTGWLASPVDPDAGRDPGASSSPRAPPPFLPA